MIHRMKSSRCRRRGAIVVFVALLLTLLVGVLAISLDGGLLRDDRRRLQGAADAAALAAATELYKHYPTILSSNYTNLDPSGAAAEAARTSASDNGFPNNGTTSRVDVNIPPTTGPFTGRAGFAEIVVTYYQKRYFSAIFGSDAVTISARAV